METKSGANMVKCKRRQLTLHEKWKSDGEHFEQLNELYGIDYEKRERVFKKFKDKRERAKNKESKDEN